jgi:hydrogenase-4 membrane subunit HyfE
MIKKNILRRILYTGAGLVILATILFPFAIILYLILDKTGCATPEKSIFPTVVIVILHLLIVYAFREAIIANKRNVRLGNVVFIVSGIGLLLFGLLMLDFVDEFLGYHNYDVSTIAFCFCLGCDFFAAVIAFIALFLQPKKVVAK